MPPLTLEEVSELLAERGEIQGNIKLLKVGLDKDVADIKAKYTPKIDRLSRREQEILDQLVVFATTELDKHLTKGAKSIRLRGGVIGTELSPVNVEFTSPESQILNWLRRKGWLKLFTRLKHERTLDKQALKDNQKQASKIPGVRFVRYVDVIADPATTEGEVKPKQGKRIRTGEQVSPD